jgi:codanin-1
VIEEISYQKYEEFHDFSIRENCVEFAAESLIQLENILLSLDYNFLSQIILILQEKKICGNLVESLNTKIAEKDELRVRESTRTGMKLPVESTGKFSGFSLLISQFHSLHVDPASCDFTLPFFEEIDSRLHYKTQVESLLYINREKTRDGFLSLLRQYQKQQNSLEGIENVSFASMASEEARSLFTSILPENRWWFSKFFVMELIQIGSNIFGENDKDLLKKIVDDKVVGKSSDRLRKLHRRFSSQKSSSAQDRRNDHRIQMSGISSDHTPIIIGSTQSQSCGEANTRLFLDNQLFFYHFLRSCDSHELSQLINTQIESHLLLFISKESDVDPRKHFTEQVLRLKVLGKFLGYLHFSSNWNSMPLYLHNPAVEKARKEATNCLDQLDPRFDVMKYLERSIERCEIVRDMPWISDYLMMLSHDRISLTTKYFRRVLLLLRWVQTGQRLLSMGENGILIYIQIDHLLQVLHAHKFLKNATDVSSIRLSKGIFVQSNVCQSLSNPHALDYLPFLCNQIYIQGCVCDLEEFKDFIHSRLCMSRRTGKHEARVSTSSSIRKLRPMQISDELTNSMTAIMPPSIAPHSLEEENSNRSLSSLELAFFKLHSDIQRNVEFAIGVVVRNSFEYTANWVVIPGADSLVDNLLTEIDEDEGLGLSIGHKSRGHKFEMRLNKVLEEKSRCCCELAAQTAKDFCLDRVEKAVLSLVSPSLGTTLCQVIVKIAIKRAVFALESLMERMARKEFLDRIKMRKKALFKITVEQVPALTVSEVDLKLNNSFDLDVNRTLVSTFSRHSGKEKPVYEIAVAIRQISAEVFKISNQVDASLELTTITTRMRILMKNSKKILKSFGLITPTICACLWRVMLSSSRLTYRLSKYLIRFNVDELSPAFEKAVVEYSNRLSSIIEVALVSCHEQKRAYNWAQELTRRFIRILVHVDKPLVCARSYRLYSLPIASVISTVEAICPGANAPIIQEYFGLEEEIDLIVRLADNLNKKVLIS